jgi:mono/diheme cytochrome c family protein
MRELVARLSALTLGAAIVGLAALFAQRQNAESATPETADERAPVVAVRPVDEAEAARGRALFADVGCLRCHAVAGQGNPRSPLDGIGARHMPDAIQARMVGAPSVADDMPRSVVRAKERFTELPEADLEALTAYLSSLR